MKELETNDQPVLAVYDIRGIQDFVFRTNRIKDIIGASEMIAGVLDSALKCWFDLQSNKKPECFLFDWMNGQEPYPFRFLKNPEILAEVLYIGGGNAYVVYRTNELAEQANEWIAKKILRQTHALSLASASVYMDTASGLNCQYINDRMALVQRLARVKAEGLMPRTVGGFPFTKEEVGSGQPCCAYIKTNSGLERLSTETMLKRKMYEKISKNNDEKSKKPRYERELDKIVLKKGNNSLLAFVHIDGNSMGQGIKDQLSLCKDYGEAVVQMRAISHNISYVFEDYAFNKMLAVFKQKGFLENATLPFRPIIKAGDDLTFVCRPDLAIKLTQTYLNALKERSMDGEATKNTAFSACAGILFANSHFPFSHAYTLAEELCSIAKVKAKQTATKCQQPVASYVDFQLCYSGVISSIQELRDKEYYLDGKLNLLRRPYRVDSTAIVDPKEQLAHLLKQTDHLLMNVPRKWIKKARNAYHESTVAVEAVFKEAKSIVGRDFTLPDEPKPFDDGVATMYDALEMFDILGFLMEDEP